MPAARGGRRARAMAFGQDAGRQAGFEAVRGQELGRRTCAESWAGFKASGQAGDGQHRCLGQLTGRSMLRCSECMHVPNMLFGTE